MDDVIFALLAIVAGLVFCFRGFLAFRIVIPVWGAFVGFGLGAGLVASIGGDSFLQTGLAWIVGIVVGLGFALCAYLFYAVAVVIAMASIGFSLGASLMVALGVSWTWVVVLAGVVLGVLLALAAIRADLPSFLLIVLSALGGASAITTGLMLLFGTIQADDLGDEGVVAQANPWWSYVVFVVLAVAGLMTQARAADRLRASLRASWEGERAQNAGVTSPRAS